MALSPPPHPEPETPPPGRERGISRMVVQLLICTLIPVLGPMLTIVAGVLWTDPENPPPQRRDGRILIVYGAIAFVISLVLVAMQLSGFMDPAQHRP